MQGSFSPFVFAWTLKLHHSLPSLAQRQLFVLDLACLFSVELKTRQLYVGNHIEAHDTYFTHLQRCILCMVSARAQVHRCVNV